MTNKVIALFLGLSFCALYLFLLYFRPMESWCDEAYWTDWSRQLALYGKYYTTVWGFGKPSYCPLYAFMLAGWFKLVGFSFIKAHIPNIIITLVSYLLLSWGICKERLFTTKWSTVSFAFLFWISPSIFQIYNCGRIENLCLLLSICVAFSFVAIQRHPQVLRYKVYLFFSSACLFATGVEGVLFATLFLITYLVVVCWKLTKENLAIFFSPLATHFAGYIGGLTFCCWITHMNGCLKAFIDTMFGFSKTFTNTYLHLRAFSKNLKHGIIAISNDSTSSNNGTGFFDSLLNGLISNPEYCIVAMLLVIFLVFVFIKRKEILNDKLLLAITTMSLLAPAVYVLAGRYTSYYTWVAYVPLCIAFVSILDKLESHWLFPLCITIAVSSYFVLSYDFKRIDSDRKTDTCNIREIAELKKYIQSETPCVIPYKWYYYVVEWDENIYFQGSGLYPDDLRYIIFCPSDYNEEKFMNRYELRTIETINDKIVYEITGNSNIAGNNTLDRRIR